MKLLMKSVLATGLILAAANPALAQTRPAVAPIGALVPGIAVASMEGAVANSDAYRAAAQQRPATYKAVYDQAQARAVQLDADLKPLIDRFNADRAAKKPDAVLQPQYVAIQQRQEAAKEEIQQIMYPVALSEAFVVEQLEAKLDAAVRAAMTKGRYSLLLQPQAVVLGPGYDITPQVVAELNALIPTAQLVPPQGWVPRQVREQQAAQAAAAGGPAPVAPAGTAPAAPRPAAGPQPDGR
jgi:Skp family chaperone for outer membrane proteins